MKSAVMLRVIGLLVLLCGLTKVAVCNDVDEAVVDLQGHPVVAGAEYYMLQHMPGPDGGEFGPGKSSNMTCPLSVVLDLASHGELLRISPVTGRKGIVYTNESVEISFARKIECAESSKWMIVKERGEDDWSVGLGSPRDHPGSEILNGYFKIQKYEVMGDYKFMFCPNASTCANISLTDDASTCANTSRSDRLVLIFGYENAFNFDLTPRLPS